MMLENTASYMAIDKANELADSLNTADDEWHYHIEIRGDYAVIRVFDNDGIAVGYL
jgi:hypothetical protein